MRNSLKVMLVLCLCFSGFMLTGHATAAENSIVSEGASRASAPNISNSASASTITYNNILNALKNLQDTTTFPNNNISYKQIGPILTKVLADHPEIFYFEHKGTLFYSNGKIELKYKFSKPTIRKMIQQVDNKVDAILDQTITTRSSDFEKVKNIHNYVVLNTAYDYVNVQKKTVPDSSYNVYGLLINQIAVCDGYAKTMKLLLDRAGVKSYYVTGKVNTGLHAWNMVNIDGKNYYLDSTWNDPVPNQKGKVSYKYFLVPASVLKQDHVWNVNDFPVANSNEYSYLHELSSMQETKDYYYYSNVKDNNKLYRMNKDGSGKKKIVNARAPYFAVSQNYIYYSNYSFGGFLYRSTLTGAKSTLINKAHTTDLYLQDSYLYYTNKDKGRLEKVRIN